MTDTCEQSRRLSPTEELLNVLNAGAVLPTHAVWKLLEQANVQPYVLMKGYPILLRDMLGLLVAQATEAPLDLSSLRAAFESITKTAAQLGVCPEPVWAAGQSAGALGAEVEPWLLGAWPKTKRWYGDLFARIQSSMAADDAHAAGVGLSSAWSAWKLLHDAYVKAMATMLEVSRREGSRPMLALLKGTAILSKPAYDAWSQMSAEELLCVLEKLLHAHGSRFSVREEETSVAIDIDWCASGGMLLEQTPISTIGALGYVRRSAETALADRFEYCPYCAHCLMWNEQLPVHWYGRPIFETVPHASQPARCGLRIERNPIGEHPARDHALHPDKDF